MPVYINGKRAASLFFNGKSIGQAWKNGVKVFQKPGGGEPGFVLLTPAMTSNTAPSPFSVTASSVWDSNTVNQAFRCFDQAFNGSGWAGGGSSNLYDSGGNGSQWIQVYLGGYTRTLTRVVLYSRNSGFNQLARNIIVQVSSDASSWTDVYTSTDGDIVNAATSQQVTLDKSITPAECQYIRIVITQIWGASTNCGLGEIELYGY